MGIKKPTFLLFFKWSGRSRLVGTTICLEGRKNILGIKKPTFLLFFKWSGRRDSNSQQPAWKAGTLANWVTPALLLNTKNFVLVGLAGLEPATDRLWADCSNQLSYRPKLNQAIYPKNIIEYGGWYRTWTYGPLLVRQML